MTTAEQLTAEYLEGPARLRAAVANMTREQLLARPVAGKLSTLEVVCHIADFEPVFADRMKRIIALGNNPLLVGADADLFLKELHYLDRDLHEELDLIEVTRKQMAHIFRSLTDEQLKRTGTHSESGPITLETVIRKATGHIPHHLAFILDKKKALGLPA